MADSHLRNVKVDHHCPPEAIGRFIEVTITQLINYQRLHIQEADKRLYLNICCEMRQKTKRQKICFKSTFLHRIQDTTGLLNSGPNEAENRRQIHSGGRASSCKHTNWAHLSMLNRPVLDFVLALVIQKEKHFQCKKNLSHVNALSVESF